MQSSEQLDPFIEPPTLLNKCPRSPSTFFQSPVKRRGVITQADYFISPPRRTRPPPDFIAPNNPVTIKRSFQKRVASRKPPPAHKSKEVYPAWTEDQNPGFGDNGGFENWSPMQPRDNIDWSITNLDIEEMKSHVIPLYWELLLESLNSIVRVTERLFILQEWDYKGHLKVKTQCTRLT
jgi:hypothetical protein